MEKPRAKKPLKTYGSQGRDVFEFCGGSDGEVDVTPRKALELPCAKRRKQEKQAEVEKVGGTWGLSSGDRMVLEPRTSAVQHKALKKGNMASTWAFSSGDTEVLNSGVRSTDKVPSTGSSMLPPAMKSTSFEQTQRSETSTVARNLEPTPASPNPTQDTNPFESTDSDGRMPTPTISSRGPGDDQNFQSSDCANTSRKRSRAEMEATNIDQSGLIEPSSSASVLSPGKTGTVDKGTQPAIVTQEGKTTEDSRTSTTKPIVLLPQLLQNDDGRDELSLSATTSESASKGQVKPSKDRDKDWKHVDELGSDDTGIGLPKEHYQPRPSKSRSGRGDDGIIVPDDYSKRPEAVAKKKRKLSRRKTTAFDELKPKEEDEDDDDEDEIVTRPGFRTPRSKAIETIKEQDELDLEKDKAIKIHDGFEPEDKPTAKPKVPPKQRGRPKKGANEASENKSTGDDRLDIQGKEGQETGKDTEADSEPEAEPKPATKPTESKKQRGRPKKGAAEASNTKTSDEKQDELDQSNPAPTKAKADVKSKKPRNKGETLKAISEELIHDSDDDPLAADESEELPRNIFHETQGKIVLPKPIEGAHASPSPPKPMSAPPETPRKAVASHKGPDKHSPISSGKVAYRVGLSKRARIEPLLRIFRRV